MSAQERLAALQADRQKLLEYVLEVQPERDVRLLLPIGMERPEPWLLDALDAGLLLRALRAPPPGGAPIELVLYCMQGARATGDGALRRELSRRLTMGSRRSMGPSEADPDGEAEPVLRVPKMASGLGEGAVKDLAYLVVAATCRDAAAGELLQTVRSQLDVDGERAAEVERLVGLVEGAIARTRADKGAPPLSESWSAGLELVMVLLETVLPKDFKKFKSFVAWRDTLCNALLQALLQGVRDSWRPPPGPEGAQPPSAQRLLARLKGSLRRVDVRCADDFDEGEYRAAARDLNANTLEIVRCLGTGWSFPWGLRVRLCEMLLRGVFDSLEEGAYIAEAEEYLALLQTRVWPLLGVSAPMHNCCFAWIHFRQFVVTKTPALVGSVKALLRRLAQLIAARRAAAAATPAGAGAAGGAGGRAPVAGLVAGGQGAEEVAADDLALTAEVGSCILDWVAERGADYHRRAKALGGPKVLAGLVDVLAFAAQSRGDSPEAVTDMIIGAIHSSVAKELKRRVEGAGPFPDEAAELAELFRAGRAIAEEEVDVWAPAFSNQLPEAAGIATAHIHSLMGARYLPFLGSMALEQEGLEVVRLALLTEPQLLEPPARLAPDCGHPQAARLLAGARGWGTLAQLQPVLAKWVAAQASGFNVWVRRQLEQEDWKPLGVNQPHSQSARELRRMVLDSLDALFGMGIPLPAESVAMHLEALDGVFASYLKLVRQRLGSWQRMMPPVPLLVRYKREVSVKQEEDERSLPGLPAKLPPPGTRKWLETVPRVEAEPVHAEVEALTPEAVAVMLCSLSYLEATLQPMAASVSQRWQDASRIGAASEAGGGGAPNPFLAGDAPATPPSGAGANPFLGSGGGGGGGDASNPFLSAPGGPQPRLSNSSGVSGVGTPPAGAHRGGGGGHGGVVAGSFTHSLLKAGAGGGGPGGEFGGAGPSGAAAEVLGSLLEGASQTLRHGMDFVAKWLAVRVVWWDMRGEWCELLYRHRVCNSRIDFVEQKLANRLMSLSSLLPGREQLLVASALLREVAAALERALLDGGPARIFIPADVESLAADLASVKQLFHADGDGVPWQDIDTALAGVAALLPVMETPTPALVTRHTAARRSALLGAGPSARGAGSPPAGSPRFGFGGGLFSQAAGGGGGAAAGGAGGPQQGGQPGSRLSSVSNVSSAAAGGGSAAQPSSLQLQHPGGGGGGDAPPPGARTPPGGGAGHRRTSSAGSGAGAMAGVCGAAPLLGPVGAADMASNDQVLLRVLVHRADHAASKYLKDVVRLPKLRDETLKEAVSRITTRIMI
ncbi:MAG: hypothetical protein J3K34DRAFT_521690 [Monoraphidium minutum]|nr:MAG: hypothetical protein J3K34DRAFT_521690 [Monoraphidium minutum]